MAEEIDGYERDPRRRELRASTSSAKTRCEMKEKYGDDRRTEITGDVSRLQHGRPDRRRKTWSSPSATTATSSGCRSTPTARRAAAGAGSRGPNRSEGDFVEHLFVANTHDYLLFFTNQGRVYERRVYDVPEMSRTSQGRAIANLLEFQPGEKIANVLAVKDFSKDEQFLMFATAQGHREEDRARAPTPTSARTASSPSAWTTATR